MTTKQATLNLEALATRLGDLEQANSALREEVARQREMAARQQERMASYEAEIARLQAEQTDRLEEGESPELILPASARRGKDGQRPQPGRRTSRRKLLQLGGAAAAAGVAAAATSLTYGARTAHAAPGHADTFVVWETTSFVADAETKVTSTATPALGVFNPYIANDVLQLTLDVNAQYQPLTGSQQAALAAYDTKASGFAAVYASSQSGIGVFGRTNTFDAVHGKSTTGHGVVGETGGSGGNLGPGTFGVFGMNTSNTADSVAIMAQSQDGSGGLGPGTAIIGESGSGVGVFGQSTGQNGVRAYSTNLDGLYAVGGRYGAALNGTVAPLYFQGLPSTPGAPTSGAHLEGEFYLDSTVTLWICVASGTPGTWVRLTSVGNGTQGGSVHYLATPKRLLDARTGASSGLINRGALAANEAYALQVAGLAGSGIPATAQGVIGNLTVLSPSANGNLSVFPDGAPIPTTASMTFVAGAFLANSVNSGIGADTKIDIQNQSGGSTPLVFDAVGYVL